MDGAHEWYPAEEEHIVEVPRWAIPLAILILFMLFCSGLNFPVVLLAQNSFRRAMENDFGVTFPSSLRVQHAARCAYRDPGTAMNAA